MPSSSLPVFIAVRLAARLVPRSSTQISWGARERTELFAAAAVSLGGDDSILRQVGKGVNVVRQRCGPKLDLSGRASLTFRVKKKCNTRVLRLPGDFLGFFCSSESASYTKHGATRVEMLDLLSIRSRCQSMDASERQRFILF